MIPELNLWYQIKSVLLLVLLKKDEKNTHLFFTKKDYHFKKEVIIFFIKNIFTFQKDGHRCDEIKCQYS